MSEPCTQAVTIMKIETTLTHVVNLLEKHEDREGRMLDAIEVVAGQTEALKAMHETTTRHEDEINNLYVIYREHVEKPKETKSMPIQVLESKYGDYIMYAILACFVLEFIEHWDTIKAAATFWKLLF